MDEYRTLLILQYFLEKKENYSLDEIVNKLGIGYTNLLKLIENLIEKNLLIYSNYLLELTDLGRQNIEKNDIYRIYKDNIVNTNINISNKLNIDDIYIPKRFSKKI